MNRNFGVSVLILCFSISSADTAKATQIVEVQPIIVQPYAIQSLDQEALNRDRQNRDEEIAIKELIEENNKLTQDTLARQQDRGLAQVNQTMLSYRDALLARDRARIVANGEKWWTSRYGDLIALTEDVDDMKDFHQDLEEKNDLLAQKYQMLTDLKDEMTTLNERLQGQDTVPLEQKETIIEGFKNIAQQQQDKIQLLTQRLGEMDHRINHFDEILAQKEEQIARLKDKLANMQNELLNKEEVISEQQEQIAILQGAAKAVPSTSRDNLNSPSIIVNSPQQQAAPVFNRSLTERMAELQKEIFTKDGIIKQQKDQMELLKSELENKITTIKQQEDQIAVLKEQSQQLSSRENLISSQADQMAKASEQFKGQTAQYADIQAEVRGLRNRVKAQDLDLKAKNESIRWLNEVLAVAKNKAEYYKLTSQQDRLTIQQVQGEVQNIKDDFAQHFKDYDQFETAITSLKGQVSRLGIQLSLKQTQVELLKSELKDKAIQEKDKDDQIVKMKTDIQSILQEEANKEIYRRNALAQVDDRVKLAKQLIDLQQQEAALLNEKNTLAAAQNTIFEQHSLTLEDKIKRELSNHRIQALDLQNSMQELNDELYQKEQQVGSLNTELRDKIAQERDQGVLVRQIQDLNRQLRDKETQINTMRSEIQSGQGTIQETGSLKQQMAALQDKADQLKQQLDVKTAESAKLTFLVDDFQKKLESKDNAFNAQLGQLLSFKNYQLQLDKQIADLNLRLQEKETQVITIKKDLYDLRELNKLKDRDDQSKDLSLSMVQQKTMDQMTKEYQDKINGLQAVSAAQLQAIRELKSELALANQEFKGMPSSDEIDFLRTGLKKAVMQYKQKDEMLSQIKANAQEYEKEFKAQSLEFQSLKEQLQGAYDDIHHKNEDLKYKNLELIRFKERSVIKEGDLQDQIKALTRKLEIAGKGSMGKIYQYQYLPLSKNDPLEEKLKQALDKIDEQGRVINVLVQKLQAAGQSVDLTRE